MSELIERISREVGIFRSEQEKAEILAAELKQDRIAKVESLLEETGVRPLLEEIKDSGFLRWSSEPVHDEHGQNKGNFRYRHKTILNERCTRFTDIQAST